MGISSSLFRDTPYWLNFLYAGQMFSWDNKFTIPNGGTVYYEIETGLTRLHHTISRGLSVEGGGPITLKLIESPTLTDGTLKASHNMDRRSAKIAATKFYINPTGVTGGTIIDEMFVPTGGGPKTSASLQAGLTERVLKPNTTYAVSLKNDGSQPSIVEVNILFYESVN